MQVTEIVLGIEMNRRQVNSRVVMNCVIYSREEEVLRLTLSGQKRRDIADKLCVSENTVKTHLSHIFAKVGVSSKKELTEKLFSAKEQ